MNDLALLERLSPAVARITLNRPDKKNALSIALRDAVSDRLDALAQDGDLKCVILTGSGGAFSAGFDFSEFEKAFADGAFNDRLWMSSDRYHLALLHFPLPLIAAVDGPAMGGGMDTAVLCDLRVASTRAAFGHPEAAFGDVVYAPLQDLIGGAAARELCLTGRRIGAEEALRLGLVSEIAVSEVLEARAAAIAEQIAKGPRDVLLRTKAKIIARARIAFEHTRAL